MSIEGFLRLAWPYLLELGTTLLVVWIVFRLLLRHIPDDQKKKASIIRWAVMCLATIIIGTWFITSIGVNLFPRTDIDRSDLNQQNQQWEQQHSK